MTQIETPLEQRGRLAIELKSHNWEECRKGNRNGGTAHFLGKKG